MMVMVMVVGRGEAAERVPELEEVLEAARYAATLRHQDLQGQIRKGTRKIPVGLYLRGENLQFTYHRPADGAAMHFHLRLKEDHYDLIEIVNGEERLFPASRLGESIEGTDLTYEDLSMRFLYWPGGLVEGSEKLKGQEAWRIRLVNRSGKGRYAQVRVWVHKKSGALMQVVGFDEQGRPLKRFQVTDIMRVGDVYTLRRMRVDTIEPEANKVVGLTYLEFDKPKQASPGGLR